MSKTVAADEPVLYALDAGVARVTLNRPAKMNAMDRAMRLALRAAFERAHGEARAILLTSAPPAPGGKPAFCSGQDLATALDDDLEQTIREEYAPMLRALAEGPIPSVAAVEGPAAGAGLHLALAADIVFAGASARFVAPFAKLGLMAAGGGSWLLPRALGAARARGFLLLGEPLDAETAEAWGLIWRMTPDGDAGPAAAEAAARLAVGPTQAFRLTKAALLAGDAAPFAEHLETEAQFQAEAGRSADYREGVAAFLEKRRAVFHGR